MTAVADGVELVDEVTADPTRFDIVVADVKMPRLGRREALIRIRRASEIPAVLCSGGHRDLVQDLLDGQTRSWV